MTGMLTVWLPPRSVAGPITCAACGCRLVASDDARWRHYASLKPDQDARGCRPACVDAVHDPAGLAVDEAVAAA